MTNTAENQNTDLGPRIVTGAVLAAIGLGMIWNPHGWVMLAFVSALAALMVVELFLLIAPGRHLFALAVAVLTAAGVWFSGRNSPEITLVLFIAVVAIGWALAPPRWRAIFPFYVLAIGFGALSAHDLRDLGFYVLLWPILVAVASDSAAYFAGRALGGPLLWPSVSPKKTWSGAAAGWVAAGLVGLLIAPVLEWDLSAGFLVVASVVLAMAGQAGDLAESWVKRKTGAKDASHILPGHGGLLDRFDAMIVIIALVNIGWMLGIF